MVLSIFGNPNDEKDSKKPEDKSTFFDRFKPIEGTTAAPRQEPPEPLITATVPEPPLPSHIPPPEPGEFRLKPLDDTNARPLFSSLGYSDPETSGSMLDRMRGAVTRTRDNLSSSLDNVLALTRKVDESTLEDLEAVLLSADIGLTTTTELIEIIRQRARRENLDTAADIKSILAEELRAILNSVHKPTAHAPTPPEVIMMVGVNGTGKTTTSGKLAAYFRAQGRTSLLCAADTFRAAAIEQLEVWAQRSGVDIIKTKQGGDPSAALYDSLTAGKARKADVVIVDTAGRLHTKTGLMTELDKMRRTAAKVIPTAPHQTFLVMDATTGQNGLTQARLFTEAANVTGIVLTKLDGTAKGGIVIAIARELGLPVVFCGIGEKMEDLIPFDTNAFIDSLLGA